jgi:tetratricopeptide (TPR) repeat protein
MWMTDRDERLAEVLRLREEGKLEAARDILTGLSAEFPDDARIAYQTGWAHDILGREADAAQHYERALRLDFQGEDRSGLLLSLGSTYRALGRYPEAVSTLRRGTREFPEDRPIQVFLAMALYNVGECKEAVRSLLEVIVDATSDPAVLGYRRAIEEYAQDLDRVS